MAVEIRGATDEYTQHIHDALCRYQSDHPRSVIVVYRRNTAAIRIRIVDPDLADLDRSERHDRAWSYLENLPEPVLSEISLLLLLTPDEVPNSFANLEFDQPVPSML